VVSIAAVAAAAVALFAFPLAAVIQRGYEDQELLRLQRDTVAAARRIDLSRSQGDPVELPAGPDRVAVYDGAGAKVAGRRAAGPARADAVVREAIRGRRPAERTPAGRLLVAVPLLAGEQVSGAIRAERSDAGVTRQTHRTWLLLAAAAAAVIALAILAALLLGRRLARPLEQVSRAARRLGDGDFSVRAPRSGVAEVDAVATALDLTAARLDDLVTRERAFSADASHQLRTPLAAIRIELEAAQLQGDDSAGLRQALTQVDRLQETIDTLLAVARDEPRRRGPNELAPLLGDVEGRWHGRFAAAGRPLTMAADGSYRTTADPAIVSQIVDVLLDNAHRHGAGPVVVSVRDIDGWVAVDVEDDGPGLGEEDAGTAFERRAGGGSGHGIGLALAQSLAHAEGARIALAAAGPHPVFTLTLPSPDSV